MRVNSIKICFALMVAYPVHFILFIHFTFLSLQERRLIQKLKIQFNKLRKDLIQSQIKVEARRTNKIQNSKMFYHQLKK